MAGSSVFLKLDGIDGSSTDSKHDKWIEVLSWSWGSSNQKAMGSSSRPARGNTDVQPLTFNKDLDASSPVLMNKCQAGAPLKTAELHITRQLDDGKGTVVPYYKIKLHDVFVQNYQVSGQGGDYESTNEGVTLTFSKVEYEFIKQDKAGKEQGSVPHSYDLEKNQAG